MSPAREDRLVLALDTATDQAAVALLSVGGRSDPDARGSGPPSAAVLVERSECARATHARRLLVLVEEALAEIGAGPGDLAAVVVGTGPGTFTGVRLGVAAARAAGFSLAIPVVGVTTLSALAAAAAASPAEAPSARDAAATDQPPILVPVTDAKRGEVFAGVYAPRGPAEAAGWRRVGDIFVCPREALAEEVVRRAGAGQGRIVAVGAVETASATSTVPGMASCTAVPQAAYLVAGQHLLHEPGDRPEGDRLTPWLRREGRGSAPIGAPGSPESVTPVYVRAPDADLHITKMRDPWA